MRKYLIIFFLACCIVAFSENKRTVCAICTQTLDDTEEFVYRLGYGHGSTIEEADSIAQRNAYIALLHVAQKFAKKCCREVKIGHEDGADFFVIKYLDKKEEPERYNFVQEGILVNPPILCKNNVKGKDGTYHACCVLAVPIKDLNRISNHILERFVCKTVFDFL